MENSRIEYKRELTDGLEKEVVAFLNSCEGGVPRILKAYGKEAFEISDSYVRIVFRYAKPIAEVTGQVVRLLSIMDGERSRSALQQALELKHRDNFVDTYLQPALEAELIEMTIPDKPNSRLQKYRLTDKGRALLTAGKVSP